MLQHKQTTDYHQSPSIRGFCSTCFPSVVAPLAPVTGAVKFAQWWPGRNTEIHCEEFWDYRKPETRILELIPSCPMEKQQKMVKRENFPQCNTHPSGRKQPELVQTCSQSASQPINTTDGGEGSRGLTDLQVVAYRGHDKQSERNVLWRERYRSLD